MDIDLTKKLGEGSGGSANPLNAGKRAGMPDLTMPEVQDAMRNTLKDTNSWMTPELLQAFATRPDLLKGMNNPKVKQ